jgi:hypothetical protein
MVVPRWSGVVSWSNGGGATFQSSSCDQFGLGGHALVRQWWGMRLGFRWLVTKQKHTRTCLFIGFGRGKDHVRARESLLNGFRDYGVRLQLQLGFANGEKFLPLSAWTPGGWWHWLELQRVTPEKAGQSYARLMLTFRMQLRKRTKLSL